MQSEVALQANDLMVLILNSLWPVRISCRLNLGCSWWTIYFVDIGWAAVSFSSIYMGFGQCRLFCGCQFAL